MVDLSAENIIKETEKAHIKKKNYVKKSLVALLLGSAVIGTFYTTDDERIKKENKPEWITLAYNQKGSSAGILAGFIDNVYGDIYGGSVGIWNQVHGNVNGINVSAFSGIEGKLTGIGLSFLNLGNINNKGNDVLDKTIVDKGVQMALFNNAKELKNAVQIGIVNIVSETEGAYLQIGVFNQTNERSTIGINFGYKK